MKHQNDSLPSPDRAELGISVEDRDAFGALLRQELTHLEAFNCARYRIGIPLTERWVQAGRLGL